MMKVTQLLWRPDIWMDETFSLSLLHIQTPRPSLSLSLFVGFFHLSKVNFSICPKRMGTEDEEEDRDEEW